MTNLRKGEEGISRERGGAGRESKRKQEKWEKKSDEIGRSEQKGRGRREEEGENKADR